MKRFCVIQPKYGKKQFNALKKQFGYSKAVQIFTQAVNPRFIEDYLDTLVFDDQGIPTLDSMLANEYLHQFMVDDEVAKIESDRFNSMEDTLENYETVLNEAYKFNTESPLNQDFVAVLQRNEDETIKTAIRPKTNELVSLFNNEYSTLQLNKRIQSILEPLGVTIGTLYKYEFEAGRQGVTDFSKASGMAKDFSSIIRIANNVAGARSVSEEFSHLMIGVFNNDLMVQRSLKYLSSNQDVVEFILGDEYEDTVQYFDGDMDLVAEEALGRILQDNLINYGKSPSDTILGRTVNFIRSKFKGYDYLEIEKAIIYADSTMKQLAKNILEKNVELTSEDIGKTYRDVLFNSLDSRMKRNIKLLQDSIGIEIKRYLIERDQNLKDDTELKIKRLLGFRDEQQTLLGLCSYLQSANDELKRLSDKLDIQLKYPKSQISTDLQFNTLRQVRQYILSYGSLINDLNDALIEDDLEFQSMTETPENDVEWLRNDILVTDKDGLVQTLNIQNLVAELNLASKQLTAKFNKIGTPLFCEFLKPFLPEGFVDKNGDKIKIEDLLSLTEKDLSWFDRWLDPMSDASNLVLQLIDAAVKEQKTNARLDTINIIRDIQSLMNKFDKIGVTKFDWMFEIDRNGNKSGRYIDAVNYAEFNLDYKEKLEELHQKYGEKPKGEDAKRFKAELQDWREIHCTSKYSNIPNPVMYRNQEYYNLKNNNPKQFDLYMEFIKLKHMLDEKYQITIDRYSAIQMRKDGLQRIADSTKSASDLWENIKQLENERWLDAEDDDLIFGAVTKKSLIDFDGKEFLRLPTLYVAQLKNPNEITEDVFSALMSYAYSACNFELMNKVINALEVGRNLITDNMEVRETRGLKQVMQKVNLFGETLRQFVKKTESNLVQRLNDYYESQVYGRYIKDQGTLFGTRVNTNKAVSRLLGASSLALLGFNLLANIANVETGKAMQRIEAIAGQFFNYRELINADKEYAALMGGFMSDMGKRVKSSKLSLFDQLFDIKQTFGKTTVKKSQRSNLLKRLFGEQFAFFGQEAGDHWLYNRTAIAMSLRELVLKNGVQMSLWEALEVKRDENDMPYLDTSNITDLDGNEFEINKFQRKVAKVNQGLFGVYNTEDANAANRVALGRLLQQYRKWIKPQMNKRFMGKQYSVALGLEEEGYYRTLMRLIMDCTRGKMQISSWLKTASDMEKSNLRRVIAEVVQFLACVALVKLIDWPDDEDRPYMLKLAEYVATREMHELGGLTPSPTFLREHLKNLKTPIPSMSSIQNGIELAISCINPFEDWFDEILSGPYKGKSTLHKNFLKAPIPGVAQYYQLRKLTSELDANISYYAKPY